MSGGFPFLGWQCAAETNGPDTGTTEGTTITAAGSTHTKGSWTELVSSLSRDCCWIDVHIQFNGSAYGSGPQISAVDIGIGGAGSEIVLLPNLVISPTYVADQMVTYSFPVQIPAGTRIAARCQSTAASSPCKVSIYTYSVEMGAGQPLCGVDAIGFNTGTTKGTAITPNASAHTLGSYAELTSSTSRDYYGLMASIDSQEQNSTRGLLLDIAIGAAASEINLISKWAAMLKQSGAGCHSAMQLAFHPIKIKAGTRLSARCQATGASANAVGLTLYGVF